MKKYRVIFKSGVVVDFKSEQPPSVNSFWQFGMGPDLDAMFLHTEVMAVFNRDALIDPPPETKN